MKLRTTLILLIAALVIGGLAYWDTKQGTTTEEAIEKSKRLVELKATDVTGSVIVETNQTFQLEKVGDKWQLKAPLKVRADDSAINAILDEVEFAERTRTISEADLKSVNLADFGLVTPRLKVTITGKKEPVTFSVGNETPTKDSIYVQVAGQKNVALVHKSLADRLDVKLDDLRSRTAVEFVPSAATRLEIKAADRIIEVAKPNTSTNAEPRWAITRPLAARADQTKINDLLTDLSGCRIGDFISNDAKDLHSYQLDDPTREVTVFIGDAGKTLLIGKPVTNDATKVYAKLKSADSIFTLPAESVNKFAVQVNDLRDAKVLAFQPADVKGIDIIQGTQALTLTNTNGDWKITAPVTQDADEHAVTELFTRLGNLRAKEFTADVATDLDKYGLVSPLVTAVLRGEGTNVLSQLLIGNTDASNTVRYVKRPDEPFIYGVDPNVVSWLSLRTLAWRTRELAKIDLAKITKLTLQKAGNETIIERAGAHQWKVVQPSQGALDDASLSHTFDVITHFTADELIAEGRDNLIQYGLDNPTATITVQADDKTLSVAVGKAGQSGQHFALWSDPPLICTISDAAVNTITKDLIVPPAITSTNAPAAKQ